MIQKPFFRDENTGWLHMTFFQFSQWSTIGSIIIVAIKNMRNDVFLAVCRRCSSPTSGITPLRKRRVALNNSKMRENSFLTWSSPSPTLRIHTALLFYGNFLFGMHPPFGQFGVTIFRTGLYVRTCWQDMGHFSFFSFVNRVSMAVLFLVRGWRGFVEDRSWCGKMPLTWPMRQAPRFWHAFILPTYLCENTVQ